MVRTTTDDDRTAAEKAAAVADEYADAPSHEGFAGLRGAIEAEYRDAGHGPVTSRSDTRLTVVGSSIEDAADALGFKTASLIGFANRDEVTVEWEPSDVVEDGDIPAELAGLYAHADMNAGDRTVVFLPKPSKYKATFKVERGV
jgi:hypothetical protein